MHENNNGLSHVFCRETALFLRIDKADTPSSIAREHSRRIGFRGYETNLLKSRGISGRKSDGKRF